MPRPIAAKAWIAATIFVATASVFLLRVSAASPQLAEVWPDPDWPVATPAEQGLDGRSLAELVELIAGGVRYPDLHSLLIVRNGHLVVEEYFHGHDAAELHTLQSVSKSVTSALVGIAIDRGVIAGVDERILDFFPDVGDIDNLDARKRAIRLEDLLTMRSGTDYHEADPDAPHFQLNRLSRGWDRFYLNRPMLREPGTYFLYDSGGVILVSSLIEARTGAHADVFAGEYLFPWLGIEQTRWHRNAEGHPHMGGGLYLRSRDMARFGLLYLRGGRWGDSQVVPAEWVERSTGKIVEFSPPSGRVTGYGYLWWILSPDPEGNGTQNIYAAMGFRAQYIFVVPEHELVVVVTGGARSGADQRRPIEFLYSHILPAVRDR